MPLTVTLTPLTVPGHGERNTLRVQAVRSSRARTRSQPLSTQCPVQVPSAPSRAPCEHTPSPRGSRCRRRGCSEPSHIATSLCGCSGMAAHGKAAQSSTLPPQAPCGHVLAACPAAHHDSVPWPRHSLLRVAHRLPSQCHGPGAHRCGWHTGCPPSAMAQALTAAGGTHGLPSQCHGPGAHRCRWHMGCPPSASLTAGLGMSVAPKHLSGKVCVPTMLLPPETTNCQASDHSIQVCICAAWRPQGSRSEAV